MSKDCPEPKRERGLGGGFRGGRGGGAAREDNRSGGGNMGRGSGGGPRLDYTRSEPLNDSGAGWGSGQNQGGSPKMDPPAWGQQSDTPMGAPIAAWGAADSVHQSVGGSGWGNSTPAVGMDVEMKPPTDAWGAPLAQTSSGRVGPAAWGDLQPSNSGWGDESQQERSPQRNNNDWGNNSNQNDSGRGSRGRGR